MQLTRILLISLWICGTMLAQNDRNIEIDFLSEYYSQDGDHSAVTGGKGTEQLDDIAPMIIVNVPMGNNRLSVTSGVDFYTSASSDNIDPIRSGASGNDARGYLNLNYTVNNAEKTGSYGFLLGGSVEFDYTSFSAGGQWARASRDGNRELALSGQMFFDRVQLIYPIELRNGTEWLNTNQRRTYNASLVYSQVVSRNIQLSVMSDFVYQSGLLSTPFNRVYFQGQNRAKVEQLPGKRIKLPVALRLNYYATDWLISRWYYRYYWDDFGISANTFEMELPLGISQTIAISPFYRYHSQSAAKYFLPYGEHVPGSEFYTSDYDLSDFTSHKYGVGFRYYPLLGIADVGSLMFKRFDLRFSIYDRSDGLSAFAVSMGLSFVIQ